MKGKVKASRPPLCGVDVLSEEVQERVNKIMKAAKDRSLSPDPSRKQLQDSYSDIEDGSPSPDLLPITNSGQTLSFP